MSLEGPDPIPLYANEIKELMKEKKKSADISSTSKIPDRYFIFRIDHRYPFVSLPIEYNSDIGLNNVSEKYIIYTCHLESRGLKVEHDEFRLIFL